MPRDNGNDEKPKDLRRQVREIADSLAIAFILAMVIRHFVLEVFKIPTKSMEPTLLGDPWTGDKILVNKFAYDFHSPKRWEVAVFKYPLDTSKNYIKRLVGLPGEKIRIRDGDVYINYQIARKPWPVQADLWRLRAHSGEAARWQPGDPRYWTLADGSFAVACEGTQVPQYLDYTGEILAYEQRDFRPGSFKRLTTGDVMAQFYLTPAKLAGAAHVEIHVQSGGRFPQTIDRWNVGIPLGEKDNRPQVWRTGQLVATGEPGTLAAGRATLVQVANVDRTFIVRVGGRELVRLPYEPSRALVEWPGFQSQAEVRLGCKEGSVAFGDAGIYVDLYYTNNPFAHAVNEPYTIKPGNYFFLGDNSVNSNDSRAWNSVPSDYLVGEAFLVLWPLGRMKLAR